MKLSHQVVLGLKRLVNQTLTSDECFEVLLYDASIVLTDSSNRSALKLHELSMSKPDIVKESFASLLILLVESSRHSLDGSSFMSTLENYNLNLPRVKSIGQVYEAHRSKVQCCLKSVGKTQPIIIDVKWRLDFCIKSSNLEHEARPIFFIEIVTKIMRRKSNCEEYPELKKYRFMCSKQQLQELVSKLKDTSRLIQSFAAVK